VTWAETPNGLTAAEKVEVVRAFFPTEAADIARLAQVAVLRKLHAELAETYTTHLNTGIAPGLGFALREISDRFEDLEAGA
jgi:hypothetical protein